MQELLIPSDLPPALESLRVGLAASVNANSRRAWEADWRSFTQWCAQERLEAIPAAPETVAAYLWAEHEAHRAPATIRHRAATISKAHRVADLPNPCKAELVRQTLRAIDQATGTNQKQAAALTERDAHTILGACAKSTKRRDLRDLALMLVGRDLMARANELVSVTMESVTWKDDGRAYVALRRRKTSTETRPCLLEMDATAALRRWIDEAHIESGPVFPSLTKHGTIRRNPDGSAKPIGTRDVSRILEKLGKRAELDPRFSGHSLRVGMTQDLVASNIGTAAILQAAGWGTDRMLVRYTRKIAADRGAIAQYHANRRR